MNKFSFGVIIFVISIIITVGNVESAAADSVKFDQLDHIILGHSDIISYIDDAPFETVPIPVYLTSSIQTDKEFQLTTESVIDVSPIQKIYRKTVMFSTNCQLPCAANELRISTTIDQTVTLEKPAVNPVYVDSVTTRAIQGLILNPQYGNNVAPLSSDAANCGVNGDNEYRVNGVGDGICDSWESGGNLAITHLGGTYSPSGGMMLQLGPPSNSQLDIYVEIDYMQGHRPNYEALMEVIKGFERMGMNLHIQLDDEGRTGNSLVHAPTTRWPGTDAYKGFQQISATHFGTCAERGTVADCTQPPSANWSTDWKRKAQVFHYGLFAHAPTTGTSTGIGEIGGNDFMVTLGVLNNINELVPPAYIEGTLMHELGHNLNLNHGGAYSDSKNCKPTHLSVMSYSRQMTDLVPNRNLEYSLYEVNRADNSFLTESSILSETVGIGQYAGGYPPGEIEEITWGRGLPSYLPPLIRATVGSTQVDWNQDTYFNTANAQYLNTISSASGKVICPLSPTNEQLRGNDDDSMLSFNIRQDGDWLNGVSVGGRTVPTSFCYAANAIVNWYNSQDPSPSVSLESFFNSFPTCAGGVGETDPVILADFETSLTNVPGITQDEVARILAVSTSNHTAELTPDNIIAMRLSRIDSIMAYLNNTPENHFTGKTKIPILQDYTDKTDQIKKNIENHKLLDVLDGLNYLYIGYSKDITNRDTLDDLKSGTADIYNSINKAVLGPPLVIVPPPKPSVVSVVYGGKINPVLIPELMILHPDLFEKGVIKTDYMPFIKNGNLLVSEWKIFKEGEEVRDDPTYLKPRKMLKFVDKIDLVCNEGLVKLDKPDGKSVICVKESTKEKLGAIWGTSKTIMSQN